MLRESEHTARVHDWLQHAADGESSDRLCRCFEDVFLRLWQRARRTLGDVTLSAIVDRVLYNASRQHPVLGSIALDTTGPRFEQLYERCGSLRPDELEPAVRFVLLEFLTVLDNLTAGVLTPALHAELAGDGRKS